MAKKKRGTYNPLADQRQSKEYGDLLFQQGIEDINAETAREYEQFKLKKEQEEVLRQQEEQDEYYRKEAQKIFDSNKKAQEEGIDFSLDFDDSEESQKIKNELNNISANALMKDAEKKAQQEPQSQMEANIKGLNPDADLLLYREAKKRFNELHEKTFLGVREKVRKDNDALKYKVDNFWGGEKSGFKNEAKRIGNFLYDVSNFVTGIVEVPSAYLSSDKLTNDESKEYDYLKRLIEDYERPVAETYIENINNQIKTLEETYGIKERAWYGQALGLPKTTSDIVSGETLRDVRNTIDALKDAKDLWEDNKDGAGFWSGMAYNADNSLTLGIKDMSRDVGTALVAEKVANGWDITEEEKLRLEAYKTLEEAKGMAIDPNSWYSSGQGLTGTIGFVLEMYASGGIVGAAKTGIKRKIVTELGESIAKSNITKATTFVAETMLMPTTHKTAADAYLSDNMQRIVNAEGETELIISNAAREFAYKDLKNTLNEEERKIAEIELALENGQILKNSEKSVREELNKLYDVRDYINSQLSQISEKDGSVKKNSSMLQAGLEGFRNTASEKIIEKTVGKYVDANFTPAIGSYLRKADNFLHNWTLKDGVPKSSTKLFTKEIFKKSVGEVKVGTMTKAIWHSIKPGEIIQSPLGEFVEEGVIQFVPSLYGGVDGYYDQIDELSNPVFWGNVALGSVVLSGGRGAIQGISTYADYKGKSDREKVEVRQHLRDLSALKEFRNRVERSDNEQLMQDIAMNTYGTFFHPSDYSGRISQLRNPKYNPGDGSTLEERKDMADKIEKTSYINIALKSIKTGTDTDLKQVLQKKLNDERTPEETKHHIQYAINKLDNYKSIINNNRNLVNGSHITNLQINKDIKEEGIKDIEKELQKLNSQEAWNDLLETYNRAGIPLPDNVTDMQSFFNNLSTTIVNPIPDVESDNTTQVMDLMYAKKLLEDDIKFLDKNLKYETNPANIADITKREKNIIEGLQKRTEEFEKEEAVLGLLVNPAPLNEEFFIEEVDEIIPGQELSYGGETFQVQEDGSLMDSDGNIIADEIQEEIMAGANTDPLLDALLPEELIKSPNTVTSNLDSAISEQEGITEEEGKDFGKKFFARQANQRPVSEQAKEAVNNYINDLEKRLSKTPTFEDVIIDHIETYGYERTEDRFNAYEKVFKSVGMDTSKSTNIYDKYFNTIGTLDSFIEEQLDDVVVEDAQSVVETITAKQEEEVKKVTTPERKFKPEMNEVVSEVSDVIAEDRKTLNPVSKFAYNFQDVSYDENTDSWSVNSRTLKPVEDNDVIDNRFILDSDFMYRIRKEPNSIKVQLYDNPDQPVKGKTFGELKQLAEKEYGKDSAQYKEWYRNNVPMVITYTGKESNNQPIPLATVHSVDWYRPATISDREGVDKQQEVINEGKENTIRLRQSVLDNGNVGIQLRNNPDNTFGQLHKIKPGTQPMSLNESNPESTIAILSSSGEFRTGDKTYFDGIIVNKEQYNRDYPTNSIAYISQVGTNNNGKPIYIAIRTMNESPVAKDNLKQNLNEKVYNNIKYAVLASTVLRNKNNASVLQRIEQVYKINLSKAVEISDAIKNSVGIDIENQGIARFVNMFTMTNYSNIVSGKGMQGIISANNLPNGITYFNSNQDGSLGFIKKGSSTQYDSRVNVQKTVGQMPGTTVNNSRILNDLADLLDPEFGVLHQVKMNIDLKSLDSTKGKELPMFDNNGNITSSQSLESVYKDYLKTNIVSHKIKTIDGKEKYITDVQPMHYFDESGRAKEQTTSEAPAKEIKKEVVIKGTREKINAINNSSLTTEQKQIAIGILLGNAKGNTIFGSRQRLTAQQFNSLNTNNIDGITNEEQKEIIETLKNLVIDSIDFNSENLKYSDIKHEIENSVDKFISQQIEKNEDIITALGTIEGMEDIVSSINAVNEKLNTILNQQEKIIGNNGILIKEFNNIFAVDFKEDVENIDENEENFSQSFLEKDIKLSYSAFLKMSFFAIPKDLILGTNRNAFGFTQYHNADIVNGKLLDITTKIPSNWNVLIDNIEEMGVKTNQSLYGSMSERFKNLPEHLKNELLYNTIGKQNTIYKVLNKPGKSNYIKNKEGRDVFVISNNEITILDENSNKDVRRIFTQLRNNFLAGSYIVNKDGQLQYDKNKLNELQHNLNEIIKSKPKNVEAVKQALSLFNIEGFSDDTIQYMIDLTVQNPIKGIYGESGFMTVLSKNLKSVLDSNNINLVEDFNIVDESASSIRKMINVEVMLHKTFMGGSIYVGGKTMQSFISNTSIYDINQKLSSISDKSYVDMLRSIPYTSKNYILEALSKDERFTEMYKEIGFSSPEAYKVKDKSMPDVADFDKIAEQDNIATVMGLYMNIKGAELDKNFRLDNHSTLEFRKGQMPVHTISDKGRMVYLTTLLLNLKQNDITFEGDTLELKQEVADFLREQIFESEFERIVQSYNQNTNIVGYDIASKAFLLMPSLNSIEIETESGPVNIHDIFNQLANGMEIPEEVMTEIRNKADEKIKEYIQSETNEKLTSDGKGILADFNFYDNSVDDKYSITNLNTKYVKGKPGNTNLDKLRFVSAEFAINNLLHNISTQQLYLGDLAYYSKDKFIPSKTITTKQGTDIKVPDGSKLSDANAYGNMLVSIGSNLQKRTALLIAPGKKIADSENILSSYAQNYIHLALNDTESMSSSMKELIESQYGLFDETKNNAWNKIEYYKNKISQLEGSDNPVHKKQIKRMSKAIKELVNDNFSDIKDYFNITGTDAQEYTTWKTHLDMLLRQGKITRQQHDNFKNKIESEELTSDEIDVIMQPVKPVHTGMIYDNKNNIMRPIYIKASSFPLLPQMTRNLNIDGLRQSMENLENKRNMPVQVSYQSANKIGALDTKLSAEDFYNTDLDTLENSGLLDSGLTVLPYSDYKIQQETPSKEQKFYKKGKDSHVIMGSQFFKILFGNFLNHYDKPVFDNRFTPEILTMAGIENVADTGKLTGGQMYDIYENVYFKYSDALKFQLESELGLEDRDFNEESIENQNNIIDKLHNLLEREITSRNYPDYLTDSINIIEQDGRKMLESVLLFDSNRYKFESLLQAIISNRLITHTLPGNGHISASSNGFERKVELDALSDNERAGIVWINGYQSELKATVLTREDGKKVLQKSQVLIKSHWKYTDANGNLKYVNLSAPKYTEDIVENEVVVGKKLNMDMIDKELLEMFSYRIPTSSHQSGAIIEVAGFLPSEMQDLLIVPKEHTTQFGEDYDIDKRQVYKYNYYVNNSGKIRKLNGDILNSDENVDNLLTAIFGERYSEIKDFSNDYKEAEKQIKLLENAFIDVYLSVYSTLDKTIQQKIYKPLVTDVAENTTNIMEEYVQEDVDYTNFNILSDNYQRKLLKMGADGKGGIGVHSNAVTFEAQMQRLKTGNKVNIDDYYFNNDGEMESKAFTDTLGGYTFSGSLGTNVKTLDGGRDISDQHGENQNVSTDNISKQIMGKRNENSYTMSVYAFMAHMGFDLTADNVNTGITGKDKKLIVEKLHIPSLFINQPILRDYVRVRQKYESISADYIKNKDLAIIEELAGLYGFRFNAEDYAESKKIVDDAKYQKISEGLNGQTLFNNLKEDIAKTNPDIQAVILDKFFKYQEKARQLSEVQQLINLSTSKLGVSYFETLQKIQKLNEITERQIDANSWEYSGNNFTNLIGEYSTEPKEGFIKVGDYYWKPTTIEGKMLINSLSVANKTLPIFFPYNSDIINNMIESVFSVRDLDSSVKSKSNLRLKYEIMTEFVNYINSGSNVFSDNVSNERKRLFFNSEGNQALGNIIKELKRLRHPIMQNSLLNDLTTKEDIITGIVKIEHTPDEQTTLDKSTKYEDFKNLLKDDTVLGIFNGEELKVSDLAQDLISYSLLSDDMNGAVGFRNYIPTDFFSIVGDNQNRRDLFSNISNNIDSQELEIMKDNFIRQYFQHNPERAVILKEEDFKTLKDNIANGTPVRRPRFVSIRNTAKSGEAKQWNMYEFNEYQNSYSAIDILGVPGTYNEYDSSISNKKSEISDNQSNTKVEINQYVAPKAINIDIKRFDTELQKITSIQDLAEIYSQNTNISERLRKLYSEILPYINNETKLIYDEKEPYAGYNLEENTISISTKFWEITFDSNNNNIERTRVEVAETILEEILHSMTVNEVQKFVTSNESGDITVSEDAPIYIRNLTNLYEIAREKVPYNKNNHKATYGSMNIEEFIANVFTNPEYRNNLENQQKGFVKEFLKAIRNMFRYLHWKTNGTYPKYDDVIFENVMEMLKDRGQSTIPTEIKKKNIVSEVKENNPVQQVERPLEKVSQTEITNPTEQSTYRGLPVIDTTDIINAEGQKGAAQYDRTNNVIKVNRPLLQQKFNEKAWTKMRDLVETIHGEKVKSKAQNLSENQFQTYEQFEMFVMEHEYQHSVYSREQFDTENPGKTKEDYETVINERALNEVFSNKQNLNNKEIQQDNTFSYNGITIKTDFQLTEEQVNALEKLIDFVENPNEDSIITLSGYAGTGKTSIIKYLERYKEAQERGSTKFIYAAPTHAATVYLGLNIGELPFTVQSMVYEKFDPTSGTMQPVVTKKFENSLSIFANNILVIDEASMIANKDLGNITGVMKRNNVKIIFMGDKAQLPEVSTKTGDKSISKVFTDYESIQLTEVKRTSDNSILGVLTEIRNNPDGKLPVAENTDTMQYVDTAMDFKRKAFQKIKEDPENTVFISYTNKGVQSFNSQVREGLGFTGGLQKGESIIGYGGYNSKKVEDGNLANSVKYTVNNVEMVSTNEYKGMDIYFSSNILEKIPDTKSKGRTLYLPLDNSDVIPVGNLSSEDYQKNNEYISKQFRGLYSAKQMAKQTKRGQDWGVYYNELQRVSAFMQKVDLGADYIYNPVTDKFEIPNSTHSKLLKDNPELKVGKGIDYGYAITVHKSQGATFSNVFFDASSVPASTAKLVENGKQVGTEGNSLLYVGMSRAAKNLTVLKGDNNKTITGNIVSLSDINKLPKNKC